MVKLLQLSNPLYKLFYVIYALTLRHRFYAFSNLDLYIDVYDVQMYAFDIAYILLCLINKKFGLQLPNNLNLETIDHFQK